MAQQGKPGSKGPSHIVPGKDGNISQGTSESPGQTPSPKKPGGTSGTKSGAH